MRMLLVGMPRDAAVKSRLHDALGAVHQALVLPHIDEAAAHEVGAGQNFAGLAVHGGHDDDEAVLRQMLAVPQDDVAHIAHAEAVHHDGAQSIVETALDRCVDEHVRDWNSVKTRVREALSSYIYRRTKRSPMILPILMEV